MTPPDFRVVLGAGKRWAGETPLISVGGLIVGHVGGLRKKHEMTPARRHALTVRGSCTRFPLIQIESRFQPCLNLPKLVGREFTETLRELSTIKGRHLMAQCDAFLS